MDVEMELEGKCSQTGMGKSSLKCEISWGWVV